MKTLFTAVCILALNLSATAAFSADRVVVIPINGKSTTGSPEKLWGQGRPGTTTLLHDNGSYVGGSCTATSGVKFALSKHLASWEGAADACPKDSWVCSQDEIKNIECPITISNSRQSRECNGTLSALEITLTNPFGWVSDISFEIELGYVRSPQPPAVSFSDTCKGYRVWCCYK
ncbi:MAG: hypothetical protein GY705_21630 [Bacteroidetes bacterium]|nr:hypothetical protein [Bacteroidota bacterium]